MPYLARATAIDPDATAPLSSRSGPRSSRRDSPTGARVTSCVRSSSTPDEPLVRFNLARAYLALGDYEAAARSVRSRSSTAAAQALDPAFFSVW